MKKILITISLIVIIFVSLNSVFAESTNILDSETTKVPVQVMYYLCEKELINSETKIVKLVY